MSGFNRKYQRLESFRCINPFSEHAGDLFNLLTYSPLAAILSFIHTSHGRDLNELKPIEHVCHCSFGLALYPKRTGTRSCKHERQLISSYKCIKGKMIDKEMGTHMVSKPALMNLAEDTCESKPFSHASVYRELVSRGSNGCSGALRDTAGVHFHAYFTFLAAPFACNVKLKGKCGSPPDMT